MLMSRSVYIGHLIKRNMLHGKTLLLLNPASHGHGPSIGEHSRAVTSIPGRSPPPHASQLCLL